MSTMIDKGTLSAKQFGCRFFNTDFNFNVNLCFGIMSTTLNVKRLLYLPQSSHVEDFVASSNSTIIAATSTTIIASHHCLLSTSTTILRKNSTNHPALPLAEAAAITSFMADKTLTGKRKFLMISAVKDLREAGIFNLIKEDLETCIEWYIQQLEAKGKVNLMEWLKG